MQGDLRDRGLTLVKRSPGEGNSYPLEDPGELQSTLQESDND